MPSYAITGASKGIGLEYVRQLATNPSNTVLAIVRDVNSPNISEIVSQNSNLHAVKGDITDPTSVQDAAKAIAAITGSKLDVLIHNSNAVDMAAMGLNPSQFPTDMEATRAIFDPSWNTAIYGVMWATNAFLPLIENGTEKKIIFTSTGMADLNLISAAGISYAVPYAIAKAGMNVLTAKYAVELAPKGIKTLALSPGWVDTWEGPKPDQVTQAETFMLQQFQKIEPQLTGQIQPEESVRKQLQVIDRLDTELSGQFVSHNGNDSWF